MGRDKDLLVLLTYGDSLSMPRVLEGIGCDQTYSELVKKWVEEECPGRRICLYNRSQGGAEINTLYQMFETDSEYFGKGGEKILMLEIGIVDCAPRPIPLWLRRRISKLPDKIRSPIKTFLHNNRSRLFKLGFRWRVTTPSEFKRIYTNLLWDAAKSFSRVYVFNILPTTEKIENHSPGLTTSIDLYNSLIKESVDFVKSGNINIIDVNRLAKDGVCKIENIINQVDGHHLTLDGHKLFAEQIIMKERYFLGKKTQGDD